MKDETKERPEIRYPTQERGRTKFEAILDATETLLVDHEPSDLSAYDIANAMGTSAPTIYHFFPSVGLVFVALAERYMDRFISVKWSPEAPIDTWQQLEELYMARLFRIFDEHPAIPKVLLGAGYSVEVRRKDIEIIGIIAAQLIALLDRHFVLPAIPNLEDRMAETIAIADAILMLSIHKHNYLTEEAKAMASRARIAYLRTVLPEYLSKR
jgi:AcrR family transcriptional regulator